VPAKIGAASIRPRRATRTASPARAIRRPRSSCESRICCCRTWLRSFAISAAKKGASGQRCIAFGLEGRDGLRRLCREVVAFGRDGGNGARLEILDPGPGRVQLLPLLALLRDGDRQRVLSSVERPGSIAHLLVEDRQGILIGDLLTDRDDASANQRNQGF
jgi:hypothetical protein